MSNDISGRVLLRSYSLAAFLVVFLLLVVMTRNDLMPLPESLVPEADDLRRVKIVDRRGVPLSITYQNRWNIQDYVSLYDIPDFLVKAFVESEDRRFYEHSGVDWPARIHATFQNIMAWDKVRGASTITEQVVRILHTRPRTVWSRWLEGFEARRLEDRFSKGEILEFYLNEVPYGAQRRGVVQASRYYFNRDLDTLNEKEMLSLAVLVRAPGRLDPYKDIEAVEKPVRLLAEHLRSKMSMSDEEYRLLMESGLQIEVPTIPVQASHFVHYIYRENIADDFQERGKLITTLDASLQARIQDIIDTRIGDLRSRKVSDGAVLVVDHEKNEVLAWVNGGTYSEDVPGSKIDAIITPRQPGSTLKPFLYALAMEKGWTAATLVNDSPLARPVGTGLHPYRNYSRRNYGTLRLREALGNSLNIPAVLTVQFVGVDNFLRALRSLRFKSLREHPDHYGEGLALGNGEVTLLELVRAYATLARNGRFSSLTVVPGNVTEEIMASSRVFSEEVSSVIGNILSDPEARLLEFGRGSLLNFPVQTAVKTGTSNDYRDAWAIGFSRRYTVGVWMGNLDRVPMKEVTGSTGPALVLRAVFAELNRGSEQKPLFLSRHLRSVSICRVSGLIAGAGCSAVNEWFIPGKEPVHICSEHSGLENGAIRARRVRPEHVDTPELVQPTKGLQLAMDPRIPDELEAFSLVLADGISPARVEWIVDSSVVGSTSKNIKSYNWNVSRGRHTAKARVWQLQEDHPRETPEVSFIVK